VSDAPTPPIPTRTLVRRAVARAWAEAVATGTLPALPNDVVPPAIEISRPDVLHGDYATNLAFRLARPLRRAPAQIAESIAAALRGGLCENDAEDGVEGGADHSFRPIGDVQVAAPGFINIRLAPGYVESAVGAARSSAERYGTLATDRPHRFNVEFVSANPTGPLHIGNARGAFVGDLLCRVLVGAGHIVTREYYFNDFGAQIRQLGASVVAMRAGTPVPEDGYRADYVRDLAADIPDALWESATAGGADTSWIVGLWAQERVRTGIEASLDHLGVRFDVWKSESSLYDEGWVGRAIDELRGRGHVYERDGATWFGSTAFGDDKDRVLRKSNGDYTYFASDVGYVTEKFSRGFDHLIYIWGADHHGTVARVKNAAHALGQDPDSLEMLLIAWVRFIRDGVEVSMSKRAGEFITLDELLAEIGVDAARWFFAARSHNSGIDFDIELAKKQSSENPVYYVQYAHARISSILRKAAEAGLAPADRARSSLGDDPVALGLAKLLLQLPEMVEDAAAAHETQGVTAYATELATTFHAFYRDRRVVDRADPATSAGRLALVSATRQALANTLALLGISAPDSM
jgi:arginyl-tRNA synthetase